MTKQRLYLFDTTLRDGQQTPGIDFSVEDKIAIAKLLDEFGIDYVEGGYPGANPTDTAFFQQKRTESAKFVAFGMTKRAGVSASNDPGLAALVQSKSDAVCFVAKSWDYHVRVALGCTNEENLESIKVSVDSAVAYYVFSLRNLATYPHSIRIAALNLGPKILELGWMTGLAEAIVDPELKGVFESQAVENRSHVNMGRRVVEEFIGKPVDAELCRWACAVAKRDYNRFLGELSAFVLGREAPVPPPPRRQVTD